MLRRPRSTLKSQVDVTVVVYSGRSVSGLGETAFGPVTFDPSLTTVTLAYSGVKPPIRAGSWVLDATMVNTTTGAADPYGFFYRVVSVTDDAIVPNQIWLELEKPPKTNHVTSPLTPHTGPLVVLENVVEVFEKGPGWSP